MGCKAIQSIWCQGVTWSKRMRPVMDKFKHVWVLCIERLGSAVMSSSYSCSSRFNQFNVLILQLKKHSLGVNYLFPYFLNLYPSPPLGVLVLKCPENLYVFFESTYKKQWKHPGNSQLSCSWMRSQERSALLNVKRVWRGQCDVGSSSYLPLLCVALWSEDFKASVRREKAQVGWMLGTLPHKGQCSTDVLTLTLLFSFAFSYWRFWGRLCFCVSVGNGL